MTSSRPRVAVVLFPGSNCEVESARALDEVGVEAQIVRWNERLSLAELDAYVLPGGWSYEDRVRAGAIAAHDEVMRVVRDEAAAGKPVLGICNGAQILAEAGLVPGTQPRVQVALAPNARGYRCLWVHLRLAAPPTSTAFTSCFRPGQVISIPIAHGEGRFTCDDLGAPWLETQTVFQYCTADGAPATAYPENPNGSLVGIAALSNVIGNVLAIMPHPERASFWRQYPPHLRPPSEEPRPDPPARLLFRSLRAALEERRA